jgi:hypothetical protein
MNKAKILPGLISILAAACAWPASIAAGQVPAPRVAAHQHLNSPEFATISGLRPLPPVKCPRRGLRLISI